MNLRARNLHALIRMAVFGSAFVAVVATSFIARAESAEHLVSMRDGVKLATTVQLPDGDGTWAVILARSPYGRSGALPENQLLGKGYAVVSQDTRGRGDSEGEYIPFATDREDGYDTLEWIARQPWCDGNVGMLGGSALGITTYMAATTAHPALKACVVMVAPSSWRDETLWMGGLWRKEQMDGWMAAQGSTQARLDWQNKTIADPYWDNWEITPDHGSIRVPIYHIGGWYDVFLHGTLENFTGIQANGAGAAPGNQKLWVGALGHGPFNSELKPKAAAGGAPIIDALRFFDHWLKDVDNGVTDDAPVKYYLMGDLQDDEAPGAEWITTDAWPPAAEATSLYFGAGGMLTRGPPVEGPPTTSYAYDPAKPVATVGGANLVIAERGPSDQRAIGEREDYLRFSTEPLDAPLKVVGAVSVELFVETDAPDTDFMAKLVDVYPDGYEALLLDSGVRLRYRDGWQEEKLATPGETYRVTVDLLSTAYVFNAGHRIAVHITSSNDPRFDPNPNTGKPLRSDDETRIANNTLRHSARYPSSVILPVIREIEDAD